MSMAVLAMMAAAVACECNNSKKAEETPAAEAVEEKSEIEAAAEEAVEAVKDAATEKAVEGINAAADAAVEAIQK